MSNRQLTLENAMTQNNTFGQCAYCNHCWASYYGESCIASTLRTKWQLCTKAEKRMEGIPYSINKEKQYDV